MRLRGLYWWGAGAVVAAVVAGALGVVWPTARDRWARWRLEQAERLRLEVEARLAGSPARERLAGLRPGWSRSSTIPIRTRVEPARFEPRSWTIVLDQADLKGRIEGPVASLVSEYRFMNHAPAGSAGAQVFLDIPTPAVAALHGLWVIEEGERLVGRVRAKAAARAEYDTYLPPRPVLRDPALLEWEREGGYRFSLFPVLPGSVPKATGFALDLLLEPDGEGWVELDLPAGGLPMHLFTVDLELHEPRGVARFELPEGFEAVPGGADGRFRILGRWQDAAGPRVLPLRWLIRDRRALSADERGDLAVEALPAGSGRWVGQAVGAFRGSEPFALSLLARELGDAGAVDGRAVRLEPRQRAYLDLPDEVFARLEAAARIAEAAAGMRDPGARAAHQETMARLSLEHGLVSPFASLFARPGAHRDDRVDTMVEGAYGSFLRDGRLVVPAAPVRPEVTLGPNDWLLTPNFRAARERANNRACFANQKTLAGAIEMYNLDFNTDAAAFLPTRAGPATSAWVARLLDPISPRIVAGHGHGFGTGEARLGPRWLDLAPFLPTLQANGYLQSIPNDPGFGAGSSHHYILTDATSDGILCLAHGPIRESESTRSTFQRMEQEAPGLFQEARRLQAQLPGPPRRVGLGIAGLELPILVGLYLGLMAWGRFLPRLADALRASAGYLLTLAALIAGFDLVDVVPLFQVSLMGMLLLGALAELTLVLDMLAGTAWVAVSRAGEEV